MVRICPQSGLGPPRTLPPPPAMRVLRGLYITPLSSTSSALFEDNTPLENIKHRSGITENIKSPLPAKPGLYPNAILGNSQALYTPRILTPAMRVEYKFDLIGKQIKIENRNTCKDFIQKILALNDS
ncbi:hypothetical protein TNCV_2803601 [Trichonephila clavipes]|nr:hypothetical protein TNCV_2803601 [Trichonephila clavipes]